MRCVARLTIYARLLLVERHWAGGLGPGPDRFTTAPD